GSSGSDFRPVETYFQSGWGVILMVEGRSSSWSRYIKILVPFRKAWSASTKLVRTDISNAYTRYCTVISPAPLVSTRHVFLLIFLEFKVFSPDWALKPSTFFGNSRIK